MPIPLIEMKLSDGSQVLRVWKNVTFIKKKNLKIGLNGGGETALLKPFNAIIYFSKQLLGVVTVTY